MDYKELKNKLLLSTPLLTVIGGFSSSDYLIFLILIIQCAFLAEIQKNNQNQK